MGAGCRKRPQLGHRRAAPLRLRAGITVRWRPFNVRHVMIEQNNIPFRDKPVKAAYMWRDMERRAQRYNLKFTRPEIFPMNGLKAISLDEVLLPTMISSFSRRSGSIWKPSRAALERTGGSRSCHPAMKHSSTNARCAIST